MVEYKKTGKRELKFKEEKSILERHYKKSIELQTWMVYCLIVISLTIVGIFTRLVLISW